MPDSIIPPDAFKGLEDPVKPLGALLFDPNNPPGTSQDRWNAFNACRAKENAPATELGIGFILDVLSGDVPSALLDWAKLAATQSPGLGCLALLSPAEREEQQRRDDDLRDSRRPGAQNNL